MLERPPALLITTDHHRRHITPDLLFTLFNSYIEQVRSSPYLEVSSDHILNDQITTIYNKANILTRSPALF